MPTPITSPTKPTCPRCGDLLDFDSQADHDRHHANAEHILERLANASPDTWVMGEDAGDAYSSPERSFLPACAMGRKSDGRAHACGGQLYYSHGPSWSRLDSISFLSAKDALQAGLIPWDNFFTKYLNRTAPRLWPNMVDALMDLPQDDLRTLLLGQPISTDWSKEADGFLGIKQCLPAQFWRRQGSLPVKPWSGASGGYLHMAAYNALDTLFDQGLLDAVYPQKHLIFRAFDLLAPEDVSVVFLGQEAPYPSHKDAMGIAFGSAAPKLPPILRNIYRELEKDLGLPPPTSGDLTPWLKQGCLLATMSLTVGETGQSHHGIWADFTRTWITALAKARPIVWVLWGQQAHAWHEEIMRFGLPHEFIASAHPNPLSARRGFFGSKPFSQINAALKRLGRPEIQW